MSDQTGLRLVALAPGGPGPVRLDGVDQPSITAALAVAVSGQTVEVGRGRYTGATETFPLRVPRGVTLTGPVPRSIPDEAKKFLPVPPPAEIVCASGAIEVAGDRVRLAHLTIRNPRPDGGPALSVDAVVGTVIDTCVVSGSVTVANARDIHFDWSDIERGSLGIDHCDGVQVTGGTFRGTHGVDPSVTVGDSIDVRLEATALPAAGTGVVVERCTGVLVGGCAVLADRDAVRMIDSTTVTVSGNRLRGERAVHLIGCTDGDVSANGIERADTAITLRSCRDVTIGFNHIADARVGVVEEAD